MKKIPIAFDCTLRDGSYLNNHNFSPSFTKNYLLRLDKLGIKYCEIGHGLGIGAFRNKISKTKIAEKDFLKKINNIKFKTKLGFFAQPKYLTARDLDQFADSSLNFIRIGVFPENFKDLNEPINRLKNKGKEIFVFFMQTFRDKPIELTKKINIIFENHGIKNYYIVDSTGSMFFRDIVSYFDEISSLGKPINLGFHGHNNLGVANLNTYKCLEIGFKYLDASFMGIGRGAGNACLEHLIINYKTKFQFNNKKIIGLLRLSNFFKNQNNINSPNNSLNTLCGLMKIHEQELRDLKKIQKLIKE